MDKRLSKPGRNSRLAKENSSWNYVDATVARHFSVHFQGSNDDYASKVARTEPEACSLIECGFEYVCDFNGAKLFRKRK